MNAVKLFLCPVLVASFIGLSLTNSAFAENANNWYGVVTIKNPTDDLIKYQAKIGNGEWETFTLRPGHCRSHYHIYDYANENRSPAIRVRFDRTANDGKVTFTERKLERYASSRTGCNHGKKYYFYAIGESIFLLAA